MLEFCPLTSLRNTAWTSVGKDSSNVFLYDCLRRLLMLPATNNAGIPAPIVSGNGAYQTPCRIRAREQLPGIPSSFSRSRSPATCL